MSRPTLRPGERVRIAMVVPSLRGGGLERVARDLTIGLDSERFEVALFCINGLGLYADELRSLGYEVHDCVESRLRLRGVPLRLMRALRRFRPHLIHAHSGTWYPSAVARALLRRPRLVFTDHGRYLPEPSGRARIERWCARQSDLLFSVSEPLADYMSQFLSLRVRPQVVPNGIALRDFARDDGAGRDRLRREWGFARDHVVGIVVGRFEPVKNHQGLVDALAATGPATDRLRLLFVGTGALEDAVRERAARLGVADRVTFAGFRRDVAGCLHAADFFLMPSQSEGLPLSLLEAMAAGLPVVASDVGGIPGAIGEPPCGLLVPPGDSAGLAAALERIVGDPALRASLRVHALARSVDFSLEACVAHYEAGYARVLSGAQAGTTTAASHVPAGV